jgi:hypothetical protein
VAAAGNGEAGGLIDVPFPGSPGNGAATFFHRGHDVKRFHIALAVRDLAESIDDYSRRLDAPPSAVVAGKYAMWRTDLLNFSINQMPERAGQLRHIGFEDDLAEGFSSTPDVNGIAWESFSAKEQDRKIVEIYGAPVRSGRPPGE